jgi:hypothetical protein
MLSLNQFKSNYYSQNGEDGILEYLSSVIPFSNPPFVVEFGAWDGKLHSNTYRFIELGAHGLFIESDQEKFLKLYENMKSKKGVKVLNKTVKSDLSDSKENFDSIALEAGVPQDFDICQLI